jgi:hypothetical protein
LRIGVPGGAHSNSEDQIDDVVPLCSLARISKSFNDPLPVYRGL